MKLDPCAGAKATPADGGMTESKIYSLKFVSCGGRAVMVACNSGSSAVDFRELLDAWSLGPRFQVLGGCLLGAEVRSCCVL